MKRSALRAISFIICAVMCLVCFAACDIAGQGGGKIKKDEIPAAATYEFTDVKNLEITGDEELQSMANTLLSLLKSQHFVAYKDQMLNVYYAIDTITCKDGKITLTEYSGTGSTSFLNGASVYEGYADTDVEIGTYSGADVTINGSLDSILYPYVEAYVSGTEFIIHVKETEENVVYEYDLIFAEK